MGMMVDDLWDISQQGIAELHIDWGGYRVLLELPIDPDEAHRSDHVVTVGMLLPTWSKTKT